MDSLPQSARSLLLRVRRSAPARSEVPSKPGLCVCRPPEFPASSCGREWDLSGLQTILPVPLLRSSTPVEPTRPRHLGHIDAAPALRTAKASATCISGLTHAASAPAALRFAFRVATHAQGSLPAGWLAFTGRASNPLDRYERFHLVLTIIPLSCSPDASAIAYCAIHATGRPPPVHESLPSKRPSPLTDPDVQISRIRFFTGELRFRGA